jgi:hypothetical protein
LLSVSRTLRFLSHPPLFLWSDCVFTAANLINQIPTPNIFNKSHYEILFFITPKYSHLRVFGCLCYPSILTRNRTKFDPCIKPCMFIGYPYEIKGYKLVDFVLFFLTLFLMILVLHLHLLPFQCIFLILN